MQIFTEDDCTAGRLFHTDLLIVTVPNVADAAAVAITDWVKAGGTVLATASGGLLNEYNQSNVHMQGLLGVTQSGVWRGVQDSLYVHTHPPMRVIHGAVLRDWLCL